MFSKHQNIMNSRILSDNNLQFLLEFEKPQDSSNMAPFFFFHLNNAIL